MKTRTDILKKAQSWIGRNEDDGSFKEIIDIYNKYKPLPRGYAVQYDDEWCATFVSAVAIMCVATDIIPKECSCYYMVEHFKSLGCWIENDAYIPTPGDVIFYNWADKGEGDNTGVPNHVGFVEKVVGNTMTIIEGNYKRAVSRRTLSVNGRYIRGYAVPKYIEEAAPETKPIQIITIELPVLKKGCKYTEVKTLQRLLNAFGASLEVDGSFGGKTDTALRNFQKLRGLEVDGSCGPATWNALLR